MPPNSWGVNDSVNQSDKKWKDTVPIVIFDNPVDGKKWECQHYEKLGLTTIQTWLLHFWHTTKDRPSLLLQPSVFDGRTRAKNYLPDREFMFKHFRAIWGGQQHNGASWSNWDTPRQVTYHTQCAYNTFRAKSRRDRKSFPFPKSRPYQVGRRIVSIQTVKDRRSKKANKRQRAKDDTVRSFRTWEYTQALQRSVQAAIRGGGIAKSDDVRKILAFCGEDDEPDEYERRHRAKFRVPGGQFFASRSKMPTARKISQLFREFKTTHVPRRMDLKHDDGTHFESGARFDTVVELDLILKDLAKRDKFQDSAQSRVWTGNIVAFIIQCMFDRVPVTALRIVRFFIDKYHLYLEIIISTFLHLFFF
jgi:hypothetical protein